MKGPCRQYLCGDLLAAGQHPCEKETYPRYHSRRSQARVSPSEKPDRRRHAGAEGRLNPTRRAAEMGGSASLLVAKGVRCRFLRNGRQRC